MLPRITYLISRLKTQFTNKLTKQHFFHKSILISIRGFGVWGLGGLGGIPNQMHKAQELKSLMENKMD